MSALRDCLKALDQNSMELLPDLIDFTNIGVGHFSPGSPPSPTNNPQVVSYTDYDSGVECVPSETGGVLNVVNINKQRTLEFGRTNELQAVAPSSAVAPSLAVAEFEKRKSCSFHGTSSVDQERRQLGGSGAQQLLQRLQHGERRSRSLNASPELQKHTLSCGSDTAVETRGLPRGEDETRVQSRGSDISVLSEDSFVLIAPQHADTNIRRANSTECTDDETDRMSANEREKEDVKVIVRRSTQEDEKERPTPPTTNRVSLLETMGSPRLFAADNLEKVGMNVKDSLLVVTVCGL